MNNTKHTAFKMQYKTPKFKQVATLPFQVRINGKSVGIWDSKFKFIAKVIVGTENEDYTDTVYMANELVEAINTAEAKDKRILELEQGLKDVEEFLWHGASFDSNTDYGWKTNIDNEIEKLLANKGASS